MGDHRCPSCGAESARSDYCDSCGTAFERPRGPDQTSSGAAAPSRKPAAARTVVLETPPTAAPDGRCPGCGSVRNPDDLFCEACGIDFATGNVPAPSHHGPAPGARPTGWTALIVADRARFDRVQADSDQTFTFPEHAVPREVPLQADEVVVGRRHEVEGFFPDIDLSAPVLDPAVSRRHAVLRRQPDDSWVLMDTYSTNGTWLTGGGPPLEPGVSVGLQDGDRIELGVFTVITVRRSDGEVD